MGNKVTKERKRKPRRRSCRHTDTWLAYLLRVRLVHCLCRQEAHQQPHKNSELRMITSSSSSTKGIAQHSLTGQAMDTATTPHSQTGNAESYKKASGLADLPCLHYDQTRHVNKIKHGSMLHSNNWPLKSRFCN